MPIVPEPIADPIPPDLMPQPAMAELLEAVLDADDADPETAPSEEETRAALAWTLTNDDDAELVMRRLAAAMAALEQIADRANRWRAPIDRWEAAQSARHLRRVERYNGMLCTYQRLRRRSDPKAKTLQLPSGTVPSSGSETPKVVIRDEKVLLAWLEAQPEFAGLPDEETPIKVTKSVRLTQFRDLVRIVEKPASGDGFAPLRRVMVDDELVPGVDVEVGGIRYGPAKPLRGS